MSSKISKAFKISLTVKVKSPDKALGNIS